MLICANQVTVLCAMLMVVGGGAYIVAYNDLLSSEPEFATIRMMLYIIIGLSFFTAVLLYAMCDQWPINTCLVIIFFIFAGVTMGVGALSNMLIWIELNKQQTI